MATDYRDVGAKITAWNRGGEGDSFANPLAHSAAGDGLADDGAHLLTVDALPAPLILPRGKTFYVGSDRTFTGPIIPLGGKIVRGDGVTVTFEGPIFDPGLQQWLVEEDWEDGAAFAFGAGTTALMRPEWWGGNADNGATDNYIALKRAKDALVAMGGGLLALSQGRYAYTAGPNALGTDADIGFDLANVGNAPVQVLGVGRHATFLDYTPVIGTAFKIEPDNVTVGSFTLNGPGNAGDTAHGVHLKDATGSGPKHTTLRDIRIMGFGGVGLINDGFANGAIGFWIFNCGRGIREDSSGGHLLYIHGFISHCTTYGVEIAGAVKQWTGICVNIESCPTGIFSGGAGAAADIIQLIGGHSEGNTDRDVRMGTGTKEFLADGHRFGGLDSRANNSIEMTGSASPTRHRMSLRGCDFVNEARGTGNTEIIKAGTNVDIHVEASNANMTGLTQDAITLGSGALLHVPFDGRRQTNGAATGAIAIDFEAGQVVELTLTGNVTISGPAHFIVGQTYYVRIVQDGTGGRVVTWGANWKGSPAINAAAGKATWTTWYADSSSALRLVGSEQEP